MKASLNRKERRQRREKLPMPGTARRCPRCKSSKTAQVSGVETGFYDRELSFCRNCRAIWEPLDETLIWDPSDPLCSFSEPCSNCAFRAGSPEQRDVQQWQKLIAKLKAGGTFYCHKGIPLDPNSENGFRYPTEERKLRPCRGYLTALGQWWARVPE